jgi:putative nucleotidyltransferase with HDIG domain
MLALIAGSAEAAFRDPLWSARAAALGGSFTAGADDASAVLWNPAGLGRLLKPTVTATHTQWVQQTKHDFLAGTQPTSWGTLGLGVVSFSVSDIERRTTDTDTPDGTFDSRDAAYTFAWGKSLEEDLARRDFTVNAMAISLDAKANEIKIVDPFNGQHDLDFGDIKAVGDPNKRFTEDALRLMRAIRFATQLAFKIEEKTWGAIKSNATTITKISSERVRDELIKILSSDFPADGVRLLLNAGLLEFILPELVKGAGMMQKGTHHKDDVLTHSIKALEHCKNSNWVVRFATLIHDVGKPATFIERNGKATFYNHETAGAHIAKAICDRLHFSKADKDKVYMLVRWHMFSVSEFLTDAAVRRFIRRIGSDNTTDMLDLRIADRLGSGSRETSWRLEDFKKRIIEVQKHIPSVTDLKVNGKDVMEVLKLGPGPKVGEILEILFEEIIEDPDKNDRERLLARIIELSKISPKTPPKETK